MKLNTLRINTYLLPQLHYCVKQLFTQINYEQNVKENQKSELFFLPIKCVNISYLKIIVQNHNTKNHMCAFCVLGSFDVKYINH